MRYVPDFISRIAAIALVALLLPTLGQAQSKTNGSVYNGFGVGERQSDYTSQAMGMGVIGVGLFTPGYLNVANPGAFSDQVFTRFSAGMKFNGVQSTDASNNSSTAAGGNISSLHLGFPIMRRRMGFAASYAPYTVAGYRATIFDVLPTDDGQPASLYEVNYEGDGGLQEFKFGVGYRPTQALSFGVSASAIWGILEDAVRTEFGNTVDYVSSSNQRVTTRLSGFTLGLGAVARVPRLLGENDVLTAGVSFVLPTSLSGARTQLVNQGLVFSDTLGSSIDVEADLPARFLGGITYTPSEHWLLVVDGWYEPWSEFSSNAIFRGYRPEETTSYNDAYRIGAGFQFIPAGSDPFAGMFARTALRFGAFMERSYANPGDDYDLVTQGLAAGLSLPTIIPGTYLDLSGQVGTRGQSEGLLVRDLLYRFTITLNFGERWFIQRRLR